VELSGRLSLSWDATSGKGRLAVASYLPAPLPLPAERQGIPMDACLLQTPSQLLDGALRGGIEVSASCDGAPLALEERMTGLWVHRIEAPPPAGMACEVTLDGRSYELPPLPEVPDLEVRGRRMRWTPAEGDELRVAFPASGGQSTLCRLADDGAARGAPRHATLAFVTRQRYALPAAEEGRLAISVAAGAWWEGDAGDE
jgi:hypothetical protein